MAIGQMIRRRREQLGMTQDQVSQRAGISKPYLSNIETDRVKNPPSGQVLRRLETAMRFEACELTRAADLARTPAPVRHEHEMLKAQVDRYRSALKELWAARATGQSQCAEDLMDQIDAYGDIRPSGCGVVVPLINTVSAGYPQDFIDLDYYKSIADEYVRCPDLYDTSAFAIRVVGDSMTPDFRQGDIVVLSPEAPPADGTDCFVRSENGRTTFKRIYRDDAASIRLQPLNSSYPAQVHPAQSITGLWPAAAKFQRLLAP